jgi:5-formyltetrahydrofolate cyclo-ligase
VRAVRDNIDRVAHDVPDSVSGSRDDNPVGAALREAKRALRERVLASRASLDPSLRAAAEAEIAQRIAALPSFAAAHRVLMTLPFRHEWDTRPLFAMARRAGKRVAMPRVDESARMLRLFEVTDLESDVAAGFHGIDEPHVHLPGVAADAIDWVLVPGVAFDMACRRLGYGGGYYDRLLPQVGAGAPRVAGAFDMQIVAQVPAAPHDIAVDAVVTESRMITR